MDMDKTTARQGFRDLSCLTPGPWTSDKVARRLREAMDMMRRLPDGTRRLLRGAGGERWPDAHVKESPENKPNPFAPCPVRPEGDEIEAADEAIGWLLWLDDRTRLIVSGRAAGARWRAICDRMWLGNTQARKIYRCGLIQIAGRLNEVRG